MLNLCPAIYRWPEPIENPTDVNILQKAASHMSSRSASAEQGGRKAGTTLCPPCQPRCTEELANSRFFVPEAVLSSDQREGLLLGKQIPSKQRCRRRQGEGTEQLSMVSGARLQLKWWEDQISPMKRFFLFLLWGFLPPLRLWIQCANIFQGSRAQITSHHGFFIMTGAVSHCPILHKHFSPCYLFNDFLLH